MAKFPPTIQRLIEAFSALPSVGPKTAERFVFYLLDRKEQIEPLRTALAEVSSAVTTCQQCGTFSEKSPCYICSNDQRDGALLCIVAETSDLAALESTGQYQGRYHVLGASRDGELSEQQQQRLIQRLRGADVREIIAALNPDSDGELLFLQIQKVLAEFPAITLSRLARGLPMGSSLVYADEVTLGNALSARQPVE